MAHQERYPPRGFWLRMGTHSKRLATVLRTDYLLHDATPRENPGQLTRPPHAETVDARKRLAMGLSRVLGAHRALATDLQEVSPGDLLEDAPSGLKEAASESPAFRPGLYEALTSPKGPGAGSTAKPVTGWGYDVQVAVAELCDLSESIFTALKENSLIAFRDVQRLECAADTLLAAARVEAAGGTPAEGPAGPVKGSKPRESEAVWLGDGRVRIGDDTLSLEPQFADVLEALVELGAATTPEL